MWLSGHQTLSRPPQHPGARWKAEGGLLTACRLGRGELLAGHCDLCGSHCALGSPQPCSLPSRALPYSQVRVQHVVSLGPFPQSAGAWWALRRTGVFQMLGTQRSSTEKLREGRQKGLSGLGQAPSTCWWRGQPESEATWSSEWKVQMVDGSNAHGEKVHCPGDYGSYLVISLERQGPKCPQCSSPPWRSLFLVEEP